LQPVDDAVLGKKQVQETVLFRYWRM
jgi:hypothetical protein